ncbi:MAG TPA: hypothetical protein VKT78_09735 [Fimbriimonadaceae bacterium]|nr:hypothetical protein [Fimbriimonadaceae bacterium]
MHQYIYASFADVREADRAIDSLLAHGAQQEEISLVYRGTEQSGTRLVEYRDGSPLKVDHAAKEGITATTASDASLGAATGATLGLGVSALAAIAVLAVPGVGWVAGTGALALAIAGAAGTTAVGAFAGGILGWLVHLGMPEAVARRYEELYRQGNAIVSVAVPSGTMDRSRVHAILAEFPHEAEDMWPAERAEHAALSAPDHGAS